VNLCFIKKILKYIVNAFGALCRMRFDKRSYSELIKEPEENKKYFFFAFYGALFMAVIFFVAYLFLR